MKPGPSQADFAEFAAVRRRACDVGGDVHVEEKRVDHQDDEVRTMRSASSARQATRYASRAVASRGPQTARRRRMPQRAQRRRVH